MVSRDNRLIVVIFFLLLHSITANAQWEPLATFTGPLCTVYFMDQVGTPNVGFVGAYSNQISLHDTTPYFWRTSDFGVTWRSINIPPPDSDPWLRLGARDFAFIDSNNGWIANYIIFRTSNAGLSWIPMSPNVDGPPDYGWAIFLTLCQKYYSIVELDPRGRKILLNVQRTTG